MKTFLGVLRYEYRMSIRRPGFWIAFAIVTLPYLSMIQLGGADSRPLLSNEELRSTLAQMIFQFNLFMPVVAGIAIADRLVRDKRLGVEEILLSTRLNRWSYLLGKYLGSLLSVLTPVFLFTLAFNLLMVISGMPVLVVWISLLAFLSIVVPAFAFITIFSLACPLVMPVRVYQVLFTGLLVLGQFPELAVHPDHLGHLPVGSGEIRLPGVFQRLHLVGLAAGGQHQPGRLAEPGRAGGLHPGCAGHHGTLPGLAVRQSCAAGGGTARRIAELNGGGHG